MRVVALAAAAAFCLAAAPAMSQQQSQQREGQQGVPSEISEANQRFAQAFNRGDAAAVAAMYTQDATILPPGAEMQTGRQAIQGFWQQAHQSGLRNLSLNPVSFETYGDVGREIGRFTAEAPGQGGQASKVEGKYVALWKRTPEGWRLDTDIWNTNR